MSLLCGINPNSSTLLARNIVVGAMSSGSMQRIECLFKKNCNKLPQKILPSIEPLKVHCGRCDDLLAHF
jgi:hypothetical protein